ncbi:hypothetical protein NE236_11375 [Actinoallomurus purpureus]|uniref:hypothetical protein n=1 Tax=Actinoallomurus purpureus TaxID=478114 RepID=UPI0020934020|nr:hypothetical protein [Actinoallomurus purpureus]MCO6005581.1 hypothetical protein [Actinoallomurus purpureus]
MWLVKVTGQDDAAPYLIVSSDTYNDAPLPRVLACKVVRREPRRGEIAEPIPEHGTVLLDRIEWLWREWLDDRPATRPVVPAFRHAEVHRLICNLIGP